MIPSPKNGTAILQGSRVQEGEPRLRRKELPLAGSLGDPFLKALARGGFQVGELTKIYYLSEHMIGTLDYEPPLAQTSELLSRESVTIYEAVFKLDSLYVRVDVFVM